MNIAERDKRVVALARMEGFAHHLLDGVELLREHPTTKLAPGSVEGLAKQVSDLKEAIEFLTATGDEQPETVTFRGPGFN